MKKTPIHFRNLVCGFSMLAASTAFSQTARVQIIHNAADPAAALVDIYAGPTKLLDDVAFRTASPYLTVPAGVSITISVAPSTSTSVADAIFSVPVTFESGQTYSAIANGLVTTGFAANPDMESTAFGIWLKSGAKETSTAGNVDLLVVHGATDAPAVDVVAEGAGTIVNNAVYGDITNYITVPAASYTLSVKDSTGAATVATYAANLTALGGKSAVVFASGFLTPAVNKNGPAFGLYAALADGTVVPLDVVTALENSLESFESVSFYPVPANDYLNIELLDANAGAIQIEVFDMQGKMVTTATHHAGAGMNRYVLDTQSLLPGKYISKLKGSSSLSVFSFTVSK